MSWNLIWTLVVKDVTLFFRNRFFAFITVLGLVAYIALYFVMPSEVDEVLRIGFYPPQLPPEIAEMLDEEGLDIYFAESQQDLHQAVLDAVVTAGFIFPDDFMATLHTGDTPEVEILFPADLPQEAKDIYILVLEELVFSMAGQPLNIDVSEEVLGVDLVGQQIPLRDRMLPMIAVFVLIMETMGLASLFSAEIEARTIQALLITPLNIRGLFLGKGITGVGMAFIQALLLIAVTGGLLNQPLIVLVALLLGAVLAAGMGFLLASTGGDLMGILAWGVLVILVFSLPAIGIIFPGAISSWVKVIPSYYLVDTINRAINYGIDNQLALYNMALLLGVDLLIWWLGISMLRRKMA